MSKNIEQRLESIEFKLNEFIDGMNNTIKKLYEENVAINYRAFELEKLNQKLMAENSKLREWTNLSIHLGEK